MSQLAFFIMESIGIEWNLYVRDRAFVCYDLLGRLAFGNTKVEVECSHSYPPYVFPTWFTGTY